LVTLFDDRLTDEIMALVYQHHQKLGAALGAQPSHVGQDKGDEPLRHEIDLLIEVANGRQLRTIDTLRRVEQALNQLMGVLLGNVLHTHTSLPNRFWQTDIGILVSRARWWISSDDLITISNAAALAFGTNTQANRMRIARAMDNGILEWVPDPSVANPQQNRRVLRSQVERLRDLRGLPD
jgi:hypothetical protein